MINAFSWNKLPHLIAAAVCVHLAACATGPTPPDPGARRTAPADATSPATEQGSYKVGNPYQVGGVWYYPAEDPDYDETGLASWYGREFAGRSTANGEIFDPSRMTAAHTTLPMPSMVRVTNLDNGRIVDVRVNDRGPFKAGRIIDLSEAAATELGFAEQGVARVRVRYLGPVGGPPDTFRLAEVETPKEVAEGVAASPTVSVDDQALEGAPVTQRQQSQSERRGASSREDLWVQVGAFLDESNANRLVRNLSGQLADPVEVQVARVGEALYHRVRVGPWDRVAEADAALDNVLALGHPGARIVVD